MIGNDPRYQAIIDAYRAGELQTTAPQYNPIYDIRTEQIKAGELPPGSRFPNPQLDTTPTEETPEDVFDPCPPGYQLIDGVCQPDTMFQQGGSGGDRTEFESPYLGDIYTPMANDPINTELRRFAAQEEYQPTIGSTIGDLFRKGMQFSPVMGLLNAFGLGPSYTETITTPRFEGGGFNPFGSTTQPSPMSQPTGAPTGIVRPGYDVAPTSSPTGINRPGYSLPEPKIEITFPSQEKKDSTPKTPKKGTGASGPPGRNYSTKKTPTGIRRPGY
jgi:hypothetical protein